MEDNKGGITDDADEYEDDTDGKLVVTTIPSDMTDEAMVELMVGYAQAGVIPSVAPDRFEELCRNGDAARALEEGMSEVMGIDPDGILKECATGIIVEYLQAHPGEQPDPAKVYAEANEMRNRRITELAEQWCTDRWK